MKLHLQRTERGDRYTMGRLAIDGEPFCDTLEPTDRHLKAATMRPEQKVFVYYHRPLAKTRQETFS